MKNAAVAKLADAPGLEPGNRKVVGVQVPSAAHSPSQAKLDWVH